MDKVCRIPGWQRGVDPDRDLGAFNGLAILNGEASGVTTIDLDTTDLMPPVNFNVRTAKGGHIYIPWNQHRRWVGFAPKVDLLGAGYAVFFGPGKSFLSPDLADPSIMDPWLQSLNPSYLMRVESESPSSECRKSVSTEGVDRECMYKDKLQALGYPLRTDTISKTYASQVRNASEGERNDRLYRSALEVIRCGADLEMLADAALDAGLPAYEVWRTIRSAEADLDFDYREETEILFRVERWLGAHSHFKGKMLDLALCLAYEAVTCNTTRPQLSQSKACLDAGTDQPYAGRVLKLMETKHRAVRVHVPPGRQANGLSHCNNYELTIDGCTI
ncbi:bifunctional DNA primase/polymerase [Blastococcus atacamensis]|uniref:hypothetical protein n=1 Tax=Blastococcus atacamensis TaxID=2070508 RepID=UPI0012FFFD35|nr:hypothetical protein [Blastococcus atacamensis]